MAVYTKDPSAVIDYQQDWSDWLAAGETITTSSWAVTPTTLSPLAVDSDTETTTAATVWLSGGLAGQVYRVTNTIVTSAARTEQRSIVIRVEQL